MKFHLIIISIILFLSIPVAALIPYKMEIKELPIIAQGSHAFDDISFHKDLILYYSANDKKTVFSILTNKSYETDVNSSLPKDKLDKDYGVELPTIFTEKYDDGGKCNSVPLKTNTGVWTFLIHHNICYFDLENNITLYTSIDGDKEDSNRKYYSPKYDIRKYPELGHHSYDYYDDKLVFIGSDGKIYLAYAKYGLEDVCIGFSQTTVNESFEVKNQCSIFNETLCSCKIHGNIYSSFFNEMNYTFSLLNVNENKEKSELGTLYAEMINQVKNKINEYITVKDEEIRRLLEEQRKLEESKLEKKNQEELKLKQKIEEENSRHGLFIFTLILILFFAALHYDRLIKTGKIILGYKSWLFIIFLMGVFVSSILDLNLKIILLSIIIILIWLLKKEYTQKRIEFERKQKEEQRKRKLENEKKLKELERQKIEEEKKQKEKEAFKNKQLAKGLVDYEDKWITKPQFKKLKEIDIGLDKNFMNMDGYEFEEFVAKLFQKMGYKTHTTPKSNDYGIDVIAKNHNEVIAIQCKRFKEGSKISNRDIQLAAGSIYYHKANRCIVITNQDFTPQAREQARRTKNIELWNRKILHQMVRKYFIDAETK